MAEAQDMKESGLTGRLGLAAAVSATAAAYERGARATLEVPAVPLHTATNRSR